MSQTERWIRVCGLEELPQQGARVVKLPNTRVAIFRSLDSKVFALEDRCPHRGGPISEGIVHGYRVTCPLHDWVIELESGNAVLPDHGCARRYESRIENGAVYLCTEEKTS